MSLPPTPSPPPVRATQHLNSATEYSESPTATKQLLIFPDPLASRDKTRGSLCCPDSAMVPALFPSLTTSSESQDPSDKFPVGFSYPGIGVHTHNRKSSLDKASPYAFSGCAGSSLPRGLPTAPSGGECGPALWLRRHESSLQWLLSLALGLGSTAVAHSLSCLRKRGSSQDPGIDPCLLRWQEPDSLPLRHQGSPLYTILMGIREKPSLP